MSPKDVSPSWCLSLPETPSKIYNGATTFLPSQLSLLTDLYSSKHGKGRKCSEEVMVDEASR